eukprot:10791495-Alexandrium_andersonii.AAC.1
MGAATRAWGGRTVQAAAEVGQVGSVVAVRWRGRMARLVLIALASRVEDGRGYLRTPPPIQVYLRYRAPAVAQVICQEGRAMALEAALTDLVRVGHAAGDLVEWRSQLVRTARRPGWADDTTVTIVVHRLTLHGAGAADRLEALLDP